MSKIPISIVFMTSTKGHFGCKTIYQDTINNFAKQIPLSFFDVKVAHIKVSEGEEPIYEQMKAFLQNNGFKVVKTVANWSRGASHQNEYMKDIAKISKEEEIYKNKYVMWLEDDSTMTPHKHKLTDVLARMIERLDSSPNVMSFRFLRASDLSSSPIVNNYGEYFTSPHFNFQPLVMRSRDFWIACRIIESFGDKTASVQCEALWRYVLAPFSCSEDAHYVWHPSYAETIHLGVQNHEEVRKTI